jgi:hypothetical protein
MAQKRYRLLSISTPTLLELEKLGSISRDVFHIAWME